MSETGRPREFDLNEIVEKGIEFFRLHGYTQGSMSNLLNYLNISRQSLYNAFGSKKKFFVQCLIAYRKKSYEKMLSKLFESEAEGKELKQVLQFIVKMLTAEPDKNCLIMKSTMELGTRDQSIRDQIQLQQETIRKGLRHVFTNEKQKHGWKHVSVEIAVDMGVSIIYGLHVMARGGANEKSMQNSVNAYLDYLQLKSIRR